MIRQFMRPAEIADELGCSVAHVRALINGMDRYPGRYGLECYFGEGKGRAVRFAAVKDYADHKGDFKLKELGVLDKVPAFNPLKIERELGIIQIVQEVTA